MGFFKTPYNPIIPFSSKTCLTGIFMHCGHPSPFIFSQSLAYPVGCVKKKLYVCRFVDSKRVNRCRQRKKVCSRLAQKRFLLKNVGVDPGYHLFYQTRGQLPYSSSAKLSQSAYCLQRTAEAHCRQTKLNTKCFLVTLCSNNRSFLSLQNLPSPAAAIILLLLWLLLNVYCLRWWAGEKSFSTRKVDLQGLACFNSAPYVG